MIIGVGCLAYDNILVTETPWTAGKGRITRREKRIGGNARNALATIAALGDSAAYLATVGTSPISDTALADLIDHGIETRFVERVAGADPVPATLIITSDGERYIAFDDTALASSSLPSADVVEAALAEATVLLIDATTAPPGSLELANQAQAAGTPIILDAERSDNLQVSALIELADHLIVPLSFGRAYSGQEEPTRIIQELWHDDRSTVVLTDGPRGSFAAESRDSTVHVPAFAVAAIDTTGCGDAFHGAYAWALAHSQDLLERVRFASAAAATVAALQPGHIRIPSHAEIALLLGT